MILPNYLKNKTRNLWDLWNYTLKTKHGVPDFLSNYFKNKTRNLRDPTNHFKNKTRDPWDISNCFKNKTCDPLNCVKKKTKGVPEILQITSKIRYKRFPRFSQTTSRTKQKGSRDSAKLPQKQDKESPRDLWNYTSKTRHGVPDILSNYFKNKTRNLRDPTYYIKKKTKGIPEILQITSKTRWMIPEILRTASKAKPEILRTIQIENKRGRRDPSNYFKNHTQGVPEILSNYFTKKARDP